MNTELHLRQVKRVLKERLNGYIKIRTNSRKVLRFITQILPNDINVKHCESTHFICSDKRPYALDSYKKVKSASLIPENFNTQWGNMIDECERRINLQHVMIEAMSNAIHIGGAGEMISWYNEKVAWSKELPNSIIVEKRDNNGAPTCIKICMGNIAMGSRDKLLCNCYVLTKRASKITTTNPTGRLMWNMWGDYCENMYTFSKNDIQHRFAEYHSNHSTIERADELDKFVYSVFNRPCYDSGPGKGSLYAKPTSKKRKK
jgi:hypothetical protein